MKNFKDTLATFENIDNIKEIKLFNIHGYESGNILNKPGTEGSIKLYHHLFLVFGELNKYEWYLLERKHLNHHFNQFNLI